MNSSVQNKRNLKGTWNQAILTFLFPVLLVLVVRWAIFEPFVIPSGSMIPNLLVHDHIVVKKFSYGWHVPFSHKWLVRWGEPQRGDIVVFRYPENPEIYYIKRLIGLPGDKVETANGRIAINGIKFSLSLADSEESGFKYFFESNGQKKYLVRFLSEESESVETFNVPENQYFFMGDNRDQSSDSRIWGFVKSDLIVGKASWIWLSCDDTLPTMKFVCDPAQIRFKRIFKNLL